MQFRQLRVANFRNFQLLETRFPDGAQFIRGRNGQGKTNLLEALNLVTSLRSFRTSDMPALIRWDCQPREAVLVYEIEHRQAGQTVLEIRLRPGSKQVFMDGNPVRKLADILGLFPTITFSSQDIQILRGSPGGRRRVMDLMFVVMDPSYYSALTRYHQALKARNALLKQRGSEAQRRPFEELLIREGWALMELRRELLEHFNPHFQEAYSGISGVEEAPGLAYQPSAQAASRQEFEDQFLSQLRRDQESGTTNRGPHRDDLEFRLQDHQAREFASEGQQRGLVLALRMGMVGWYRQRGGTPPVILADDIVGELDAGRRKGFWRMLGTESQIIATGTVFPQEDDFHQWTHWTMLDGAVSRDGEDQP